MNRCYCKFLCRFIIVMKNQRVSFSNWDTVPAHTVGDGKHTTGTYYPNIFYIIDLTDIINGAAHGELCTNNGRQGNNKK